MQIDYSGPYPQMRSPLPYQAWLRYHELAVSKGFMRKTGAVVLPPEKSAGIDSNPQKSLEEKNLGQKTAKITLPPDATELDRLLAKHGFDPRTGARADWDQGPAIARSKSGPRASRFDPQPLSSLTSRLINREGWSQELSLESLKDRWAGLVGQQVAENSHIETLQEGRLTIRASSTAWANQLQWLLPQLEKILAQQLGPNTVKQVIVRGPQVRSWKKGPWSVKGRGPRDTYG